MHWEHPTGGLPRSIDILALGPSQREYHAHLHSAYDPAFHAPDEVWTLNKGIRSLSCDLAFVLDDLEGERRKSPRYAGEIKDFARRRPVITSELMECERDRWPGQFYDYPLTQIIDCLGTRLAFAQTGKRPASGEIRAAGMAACMYLHNSIPMILAYALFIGVREIRLWGADYSVGSSVEANRPNCEYWVGFLRACGVRIIMPASTSLLNTNQAMRVYGYARDPVLEEMDDE